MARLGRSTVEWFLRKPTVVGASVAFRAILTRLAVKQVPPQVTTQRGPHSELRPPTQVAPSVTFRPVQERLARTPRQYVSTSSRLRAPTVITAAPVAFVAPPVKVKLGQPARSNFHTLSRLQRPTVVGAQVATFVATPIKTRLGQPARSNFHTIAKLSAPTVVAPSVVFVPVRVGQARPVLRPAQRVRGVLRPPATLQAPPAGGFVAAPVSTKIARTPTRAFHVASTLRAPTTVAPSVAFKTFAPKLVQPPRAAFRYTSRLRPPTVVAPSITFGPLKTRLAPSPRQALKQHSRLLPVPFFATPTKTRLTVSLAPSPTQARRTRYRLGRTPIVGAQVVFTFLTSPFGPSSFTTQQTTPDVADFDPETHNPDAPYASVSDFDPPSPR